ncbi:hypothetical protein BO82DRAFT_432429 [Aspergillus uvarum CBS 121591]|uniref:Peptidyl-prolyl isomerase CWC27 n=1 Tax=Aspergillus uvarum CBS 121591 TaxID=1448315 RepID=A0A319C6P1_9EURO|nr:hypothetical protein BO82DRAFT_432429 [Aspergillus uvarum CBS 121591]PYH81496.1 hypothetical protein BO82DRAFT_432429 [Aspergillus uvarum CBS 121591]
MSTHYNTEPPATATATLHTTLGPIHLSLFGAQTPLTTRNFLQHVADNYYTGTIFHRVAPGFVIQGGDPTGTGAGGTSIYEEPEFETDPDARDPTEKIVLRDELHSRLRFNRRGLVGMAKSEDGTYGSQFFITLANTERELNGQCTLFGRVEGDSIFTVLKIAEAEVVAGTERPVYPVKVTGCEVGELGRFAGKVVLNRRVAAAPTAAGRGAEKEKGKGAAKKKSKKPKKTLLSFAGGDGDGEGDDDEEEGIPVRAAKPKYNATLVSDAAASSSSTKKPHDPDLKEESPLHTKRPPPTATSSMPPPQPAQQPTRKPSTPDPSNQLPLPDPESPISSPEPTPAAPKQTKLDRTNAEIEAVMASMRRSTAPVHDPSTHKKSALEAMIPSTAIRGRRRPGPGSSSTAAPGTSGGGSNGITGFSSNNSADAQALKMFNAFKAKLENADSVTPSTTATKPSSKPTPHPTSQTTAAEEENEDEEAQLCDLHFIANCQSCQSWNENPDAADENPDAAAAAAAAGDPENDRGWLTHQLRFGKDTLGKDLNWKKEHPEDVDSLMVIDPREKEREIVASSSSSGKKRGLERDRERERKRGRVGDLEWERERRR